MHYFFLLTSVAFVAGILSAMTGGSGTLMLPALISCGVPTPLALGTNKLYTASSLGISVIYYRQRGFLIIKRWLGLMAVSLLGTVVGVAATGLIDADALRRIVLLLIAVICLASMWLSDRKLALPTLNSWQRYSLAAIIGAYSGFVGAGSGLLWNCLALTLLETSELESAALSRLMCLSSNTLGLLLFLWLRQVDFKLGLGLVVAGSVGAFVGSKLSVKHGRRVIRPALVITTVLICFRAIF